MLPFIFPGNKGAQPGELSDFSVVRVPVAWGPGCRLRRCPWPGPSGPLPFSHRPVPLPRMPGPCWKAGPVPARARRGHSVSSPFVEPDLSIERGREFAEHGVSPAEFSLLSCVANTGDRETLCRTFASLPAASRAPGTLWGSVSVCSTARYGSTHFPNSIPPILPPESAASSIAGRVHPRACQTRCYDYKVRLPEPMSGENHLRVMTQHGQWDPDPPNIPSLS